MPEEDKKIPSVAIKIRIVCGIIMLLAIIPAVILASYYFSVPVYLVCSLYFLFNRNRHPFIDKVVLVFAYIFFFLTVSLFIGPDVYRALPSYLKSADIKTSLLLIFLFIVPRIIFVGTATFAVFFGRFLKKDFFRNAETGRANILFAYFALIIVICMIPFAFNKENYPYGFAGASNGPMYHQPKILDLAFEGPNVPSPIDFDEKCGCWNYNIKFKNISDKEAYINRISYFPRTIIPPFADNVQVENATLDEQKGVIIMPQDTAHITIITKFPVSNLIKISGSNTYEFGY